MSDSPINFMLYGHTPSFIEAQQTKNKLLNQKLTEVLEKLSLKREENARYLKQLDNA